MKYIFVLFCFLIITVLSCKTETKNYINLPSFVTQNTLHCVIEIPAGTNKKYELNKTTNSFDVELIDGKPRIKPYLPYPSNYGFIPSTFSDKLEGGDGDPIDVFVISETLPQGTVLEIIPIGMLRLLDDGEMDDKIIAIPAAKKLQTITATSLSELASNYPKVLEIIELWLTHSDTKDSTVINGWVNEKAAIQEVQRLNKFYKLTKD